MRRLFVICGVILVLAAGAAGQTTDDDTVDPRPGLIDADSPLYGLDVAADNAAVSLSTAVGGTPVLGSIVGSNRAADVVHERASEAVVAAEANDTVAAERAAGEASRVAQVAHGVNGDGLEQAETLLREVKDRVPEEAHGGLDTAINEVMKARERMPTDLPEDPEIPDQPSVDTPAPAAGGE